MNNKIKNSTSVYYITVTDNANNHENIYFDLYKLAKNYTEKYKSKKAVSEIKTVKAQWYKNSDGNKYYIPFYEQAI